MTDEVSTATSPRIARTDVELLGDISVFAGLQSAQLHILAFSGSRIDVDSGEVLYEAGSRPGAGYLVLEGTGEASPPEGDSPQHRTTVEAGSFLAELAMVANLPVSMTVRAKTPMRLLKIGHELFLRVCSEFPEAGAAILAALAQRLDTSLAELNEVQDRLRRARSFSRS